MRGHITKRFEDSYSICISLGKDPATGKYKQHYESIKGTKRDAEKRLAELLHQLDTGIFIKPGKMTVADYLQMWLKDYCLPNLSPKTTEGYDYIIHTYLGPCLGQRPLTGLKPQHLQRFYSDMLMKGGKDGKGLSNRTVRYCHATLQ
jgi:integrase